MRKILNESQVLADAQAAIDSFHPEVLNAVITAVNGEEWVVVGMRSNPVVKKARKHLEAKGIKFRYIEHGGYLSKWHDRLAIKLWSGWPTFPQVFHKGKLVGGAADLIKYLP